MKKTLSAFLASLMLLSLLASCAQDGSETATTASDTAASVGNSESDLDPTLRKNAKDSLPGDLNFDGLSVTIHSFTSASFDSQKYDTTGNEDETGDVLGDAVYRRTAAVAERLNARIQPDVSTATKWQDFSAELDSVIMAGDDAWQIVYAMGNSTIQSNRGNLFLDLSNAKYLDWTQPWWWNEAMDEVSLDGQVRKYLVGDLALSDFMRAGCLYFNKDLYNDAFGDPDEMYKTVLDGNWTYDKMQELSASAYQDLNGNGVVDEGDIYGVVFGSAQYLIHAEYALDIQHYYRDEEGLPVIEYDLERSQLAVEKIKALLYNTIGNEYRTDYVPNTFFTEGNLLYFPGQFLNAFQAELRDMESDYGIIPYPKLDDTQKEYENMIHNSANYVTVPVTCGHIDEVSAVLEALCAESYRSVVEVFFETAMKAKYSRDSYSGQCIDLIRSISKKNFAYEYNGQFGSGNLIADCISSNSGGSFSSTYASVISASNKKIRDGIETLLKEQAG